MDTIIIQNIAADASWIIEHRLGDKRRSTPFQRLAQRLDERMPAELGVALQRAVSGLLAKHPAVAAEIGECVARWKREMARD